MKLRVRALLLVMMLVVGVIAFVGGQRQVDFADGFIAASLFTLALDGLL